MSNQFLSLVLDQIEARANAATPGPWLYDGQSYAIGNMRMMLRPDVGVKQQDAIFIAAARSDVPKLVKALRRAVEQLRYVAEATETLHLPFDAENTLAELAALLSSPEKKEQDFKKPEA